MKVNVTLKVNRCCISKRVYSRYPVFSNLQTTIISTNDMDILLGKSITEDQQDVFTKYEDFFKNRDILKQPFNTNPFLFWKTQKVYLKPLIPVIKDYLCIGTSAANIERVWSYAGITITKRRANLGSKTASNLIFLHSNIDLYPKYSFSFQ